MVAHGEESLVLVVQKMNGQLGVFEGDDSQVFVLFEGQVFTFPFGEVDGCVDEVVEILDFIEELETLFHAFANWHIGH